MEPSPGETRAQRPLRFAEMLEGQGPQGGGRAETREAGQLGGRPTTQEPPDVRRLTKEKVPRALH